MLKASLNAQTNHLFSTSLNSRRHWNLQNSMVCSMMGCLWTNTIRSSITMRRQGHWVACVVVRLFMLCSWWNSALHYYAIPIIIVAWNMKMLCFIISIFLYKRIVLSTSEVVFPSFLNCTSWKMFWKFFKYRFSFVVVGGHVRPIYSFYLSIYYY